MVVSGCTRGVDTRLGRVGVGKPAHLLSELYALACPAARLPETALDTLRLAKGSNAEALGGAAGECTSTARALCGSGKKAETDPAAAAHV